MAQAVLRIDWLPASALDAACEFHEAWLEEALHLLDGDADALAIVLPSAPADHVDWRRAAARDLARAVAPQRVNLIAGDDEPAVEATVAFLGDAPGVTGQLLEVSAQGGGPAADD